MNLPPPSSPTDDKRASAILSLAMAAVPPREPGASLQSSSSLSNVRASMLQQPQQPMGILLESESTNTTTTTTATPASPTPPSLGRSADDPNGSLRDRLARAPPRVSLPPPSLAQSQNSNPYTKVESVDLGATFNTPMSSAPAPGTAASSPGGVGLKPNASPRPKRAWIWASVACGIIAVVAAIAAPTALLIQCQNAGVRCVPVPPPSSSSAYPYTDPATGIPVLDPIVSLEGSRYNLTDLQFPSTGSPFLVATSKNSPATTLFYFTVQRGIVGRSAPVPSDQLGNCEGSIGNMGCWVKRGAGGAVASGAVVGGPALSAIPDGSSGVRLTYGRFSSGCSGPVMVDVRCEPSTTRILMYEVTEGAASCSFVITVTHRSGCRIS